MDKSAELKSFKKETTEKINKIEEEKENLAN